MDRSGKHWMVVRCCEWLFYSILCFPVAICCWMLLIGCKCYGFGVAQSCHKSGPWVIVQRNGVHLNIFKQKKKRVHLSACPWDFHGFSRVWRHNPCLGDPTQITRANFQDVTWCQFDSEPNDCLGFCDNNVIYCRWLLFGFCKQSIFLPMHWNVPG